MDGLQTHRALNRRTHLGARMDSQVALAHPARRPDRDNCQRDADRDCRAMVHCLVLLDLPALSPAREGSFVADHNCGLDRSLRVVARRYVLDHTSKRGWAFPERDCLRGHRRSSVAAMETRNRTDSPVCYLGEIAKSASYRAAERMKRMTVSRQNGLGAEAGESLKV